MKESIKIDLPKGESLYLKATNEFMKKVKDHFKLDTVEDITDDHLRMFVYGALKNATDKAKISQ